ncbi:SNF1-interacting protein, partial [Ascosphaera atra]
MFDVSTKALFHVIFGDRSNIWYVLQHRLGGKNIHQGPWLSQGSNRMRRDFTYNVEYTNALGKITKLDVFDYQLIDVMNDHLCYVITDKKTPWNLPLKRSFRLVTKAVLTHVAKSRSKLSIYTMAEWHARPPLVASVIEKKAMLHLRGQAVNLMDLVTAEVRKLETQNNQTKKAIAIYGQIGHKKETIQFPLPQDSETTVAPMQHTGLVSLMLEAADGLSRASLKEVLTWFISSVKWCSKIASAHKILLILLLVSAMWNMMHTYYDSLHWMQERSAANFMNRIGVRPTGTIARAVYIEDMDAAIARGPFLEGGSNSTCFSVFHEANSPDAPDDFFHAAPKMDSNSRTSTKRVRKTRQRL